MKRQLTIRYPSVQWSTDEKCQWNGHCQYVQVIDPLTFHRAGRTIVIDTLCSATITKNGELEILFKARINPRGTEFIVPLGKWKQFDQDNVKEDISKIFELQVKILIEILYKRK